LLAVTLTASGFLKVILSHTNTARNIHSSCTHANSAQHMRTYAHVYNAQHTQRTQAHSTRAHSIWCDASLVL
jgi:hypothetical protein